MPSSGEVVSVQGMGVKKTFLTNYMFEFFTLASFKNLNEINIPSFVRGVGPSKMTVSTLY